MDKLTAEAEKAADKNNIQLLTRKYQKRSHPIKDKEGSTLETQQEQMSRLVEHFRNLLNQSPPALRASIQPAEVPPVS